MYGIKLPKIVEVLPTNLPLIYADQGPKQECVERCFGLVKNIEDRKVQTFLLSGILVFADKIITDEESRKMKGLIMMTKVAQLFEEEKQEAVRLAVKEADTKTALKLLKRGMSVDDILGITEILTREEIVALEQGK